MRKNILRQLASIDVFYPNQEDPINYAIGDELQMGEDNKETIEDINIYVNDRGVTVIQSSTTEYSESEKPAHDVFKEIITTNIVEKNYEFVEIENEE